MRMIAKWRFVKFCRALGRYGIEGHAALQDGAPNNTHKKLGEKRVHPARKKRAQHTFTHVTEFRLPTLYNKIEMAQTLFVL